MSATILVGIGGALGAVARHAVYERVDKETPIPHATLIVNVVGSFVLGLLTGLATGAGLSVTAFGILLGTDDVLLLIGTGACGAFTTFSTFAFETVDRHQRIGRRTATVNAVGTFGLAIAAVTIGLWVGSLV